MAENDYEVDDIHAWLADRPGEPLLPPEPPVPPPPEPYVDPENGGVDGAHAHWVPHPEYSVDIRGDGCAVLKHDTVRGILSAHCRHPDHGRLCRVQFKLTGNPRKPAQGRPVGALMAWLACAGDFLTQGAHQARANISWKLKPFRIQAPIA